MNNQIRRRLAVNLSKYNLKAILNLFIAFTLMLSALLLTSGNSRAQQEMSYRVIMKKDFIGKPIIEIDSVQKKNEFGPQSFTLKQPQSGE